MTQREAPETLAWRTLDAEVTSRNHALTVAFADVESLERKLKVRQDEILSLQLEKAALEDGLSAIECAALENRIPV